MRIDALLTLACITAVGASATAAAQLNEVVRRVTERPPGFLAGKSAIAGRVVDARTHGPVRRARVEASLGPGQVISSTTDDEGRFEFVDLPAARSWRVTVSKGGYVTWQFGQRRPFEAPPPVALAEGQRLTADVLLTRGGVIAGHVSDEAGEPLEGLDVRVYRARMAGGYRRLEAVGAADRTDDMGAYRVYGLPPGDYYVAASLRVAPADSVVQTTYAPTYYPGTGDLAEAQRIKLGLGEEATAVFPLLPVRHVRVSGTVVTSAGSPANAFLTLTSDAAEFGTPLGIGGVTRADGTFTIPEVPPGRYTLGASLRGDGPSEVAAIPVAVGTEDVAGATLITAQPATMRGRFVVDAGVSSAVPAGLSVVATAARPGGTVLSSGSGTAFELKELEEPFYMRVDGLPEGWDVRQVLVNGIDVTDAKVVVGLAQQAEARIVITDRAAEVNGTVATGDRSGTGGVSVVVFPADPARWTFPARFLRHARVDQNGRFRITGLPPDDRYLALAVDYLEEGEHFDPEFLGRVRDLAVPFGLGEAEKRTLDLTVIERAGGSRQ
jgi:hypothetical protein